MKRDKVNESVLFSQGWQQVAEQVKKLISIKILYICTS